MKKILLSLMIASTTLAVNAQQPVSDQNPDYKSSVDKYKAALPAILTTTAFMNTTVQETYKAYDWRTSKNETKLRKRALRTERNRLFNNYKYRYYDPYGYNRGNYCKPYRYNNYNGWRW